jgi:flagellar protein FliL
MASRAEDDSPIESMEGLPRKKFSGKKLVLFIFLPLLLIGGAAGGIYFSGALDLLFGEKANLDEIPKEEPVPEHIDLPVFYDLPPMLVNLSTGGKRPSFLKINISLQLAKAEDVAAIEHVLPRIVDSFQIYLRELKPDDLKGSAGVYRLRQELLTRISASAFPLKAKDVLFREILVQ